MICDCLGRLIKEEDIIMYAKDTPSGEPVMCYGRVDGIVFCTRRGSVQEILNVRTPPPPADKKQCLFNDSWQTDRIVQLSASNQLFRVNNPPAVLLAQFVTESELANASV